MKLEHQVCSLEHAKRLKELGVKQESHFVWYTNGDSSFLLDCPGGQRPMEAKSFSAFTVAELEEMLPNKSSSWRTTAIPEWQCSAFEYDPDKTHHESANTEADARAKMLVYLIENKLVSV